MLFSSRLKGPFGGACASLFITSYLNETCSTKSDLLVLSDNYINISMDFC